MEMTTQDYLKKAILDTQERVRDFQNYSQDIEDERLSNCFKQFAVNEATQATKLQDFLKEMK